MNTKLLLTAILPVFFLCSGTAFAASGSTLDFDGVDNYVVADDNAIFDQANRLSISVWIQPDNTPGGDEYIVYRYNDYYLKIDSNRKIIASVHTDAETVTSVSAITADGARWTHIEMTYDKDIGGVDELKLYIDGVLDGVGDYSTANAVSAELLYVGAADLDGDGGGNTPVNFFDGKIDDVRLYQYARSLTDVQMDFNDGLATRLGGLSRGGSQSASSGSLTSSGCALDPASCMDFGLVASYDFDEGDGQTLYNAADTGSVNDGTLGSSASVDTSDPTWTSGGGSPTSASSGSLTSSAAGSALQFDCANDYIDCGNDSSLDITDAITIEAWVKFDSQINGCLITKGTGADNNENGIRIQNNGNLYVSDEFVDPLSTSYTSYIGKWTHIAIVSDSSGSELFFNSDSKDTGIDIANFFNNSGNFRIGKPEYSFWGSGDTPFNGSIDNVKIYNRACSAEEVRYHYNRGGPVAHWKMDEGEGSTLYDETSNNNDGALHLGSSGNTATSSAWVSGNSAAGPAGSAIDFDGTDDYIDCGSDSSLDITDAITISAWVKRNSVSGYVTGYRTIVSKGQYVSNSTGLPYGMYWHSINNTLAFSYSNGTSGVDLSKSWAFDKSWHAVTVSAEEGGKVKFYIDGTEINSEDFSGSFQQDNDLLYIGWAGSDRWFNGKIDDVRIYNYARTPAQIQMDYNAGFAAHLK